MKNRNLHIKNINIFKYKYFIYSLIITIFILNLVCCRIFSFTTSSLPKEVKSFYIENFVSKLPNNKSQEIAISLTQNLKEKLNGIGLTFSENYDIKFSGTISNYEVDVKGEIKEVKITLNIEYIDYEKKKQSFPITKYKPLESNSEEPSQTIIKELTTEIINEVWNNTIAKW